LNYLLDTNIVSAVAPSKAERPVALVDWLDAASPGLYLSVVTVTEIRDGIAKALREGASRKAAHLADWWDAVEHLYGERILPFDISAAKIAGQLIDVARGSGAAPGFADAVIAATAKANGLLVLTRNTKHFAAFGERVIDPLLGLPPLPAR
jgi:toxin FitB